jgi:hypothetical protein
MTTQNVIMTQTVANVSADANGVVAVRYINTYTDSTNKVIQEAIAGEYINPGDDYSQKDPKVIAMCQLIQTQSVIATYKEAQNANINPTA